jgi:hypothetical protein
LFLAFGTDWEFLRNTFGKGEENEEKRREEGKRREERDERKD